MTVEAFVTITPSNFAELVETEEILVVRTAHLVSLILAMISIFGLYANWCSMWITRRAPELQNCFGMICFSQYLANSGLLLIFLFWCVPMTWFRDDQTSLGFWGKLMGQINTLFWDNCVYSHLVVSINRAVTIAYPTKSHRWFTPKNSRFIVAISWSIAATLNIPYFYRDRCWIVYTPESYTWDYADNECGYFIGTILDCYVGMGVFSLITIIDIFTLLSLKFGLKQINDGATAESSARRRKMEIRFFMQSCIQLVIFIYLFASFYFISKFFTSKWALFFTITFSWQMCHSLDGCVLLLFFLSKTRTAIAAQTASKIYQKDNLASTITRANSPLPPIRRDDKSLETEKNLSV